ncbi:MAG: LacI family DNA-binding transcriptional regulator [Victivallales bacterium]|nr:hypothetical protein [Lentisphaeria bacterium]HCG47833.1 hypothetical protein [Lentisphaeria bacterium]
MAVTMKDIAERAGVSRPVVCAVLGGKSTCRVSDEKKQRILELVKELGFQPNLQAQRLRSGKTRTVGILFASFRDRIIGDVMMELYRRLLKSGYTSIFAIWEKASEIEQAYKNVIRNQVDGIITCDYHPEWIQEKIPVVVYGKQYPETDCISIDYSTAFSEAAEYLCSLGHSRFGYIGCHGERYENYAAVMDKYGLADSDYVFDGMGYPENGIKGMQFFLRMEKPPTAIFCHNDSVALSAMAEAQRNGLEIGSDISIIGIDNTLESGFSYPALTTIDTFIGQKAGIMVDLLLERFGAPEKKAVSLTLKSKLIIRKSCGPARERT